MCKTTWSHPKEKKTWSCFGKFSISLTFGVINLAKYVQMRQPSKQISPDISNHCSWIVVLADSKPLSFPNDPQKSISWLWLQIFRILNYLIWLVFLWKSSDMIQHIQKQKNLSLLATLLSVKALTQFKSFGLI